jgi:prepilin-type N-terminal cleavage/methylation domain-containing protein/prepilin-type processing-associated H-X9-DG protein
MKLMDLETKHANAVRVRKNGEAFTLVELLTVLAIVALLTAALVPAVGKALHNARRAQAGANLRQVALSYSMYVNETGQPRTLTATTVYDWALVLAKNGGVNEAKLYYYEDDPLVAASSAARPRSVAFTDGAGAWTINPDFSSFPLSIAVVSGLAANSDPSTTPVAWTRGLQESGTWKSGSAWNGEGGFIAFLDGHVEWYTSLTGDDNNGVLVNYTTKKPTAHITEAINSTATILETN